MLDRMKNSKLLMRQMTVIIIVFVFVFLLAFANAHYHWKNIRRQEEENRNKEINGIFATLSDLDQSVKLLAIKIHNNEQVQKIRYHGTLDNNTIEKIQIISAMLGNLLISQNNIYNIFVAYHNTGLVVTSGGSLHIDTFLDNCNFPQQVPNLAALMQQRRKTAVIPNIYIAQKNLYVSRSPACTLYLYSNDDISIFIFLSNEEVNAMMDNLLYSDSNFLLVLSPDGEIIFRAGEDNAVLPENQPFSIPEYTAALEDMNDGYHVSFKENQQLICITGAKEDFNQYYNAELLLWGMMGACAAFVLLLYAVLNRQIYQPVNQIIKNFKLNTYEQSNDEYALISAALSNMEEKIRQLNYTLEKNQHSAIPTMINRMLEGAHDPVIPERFKNARGWLILSIACEAEDGGSWMELLEQIDAQPIGRIDRLRVFMIQAHLLTDDFIALLSGHCDAYAAIGISSVHHDVSELRSAYKESLEVMECTDPQPIASGLFHIHSPEKNGGKQSIPLDLQTTNALISAITRQDTMQALGAIEGLFRQKISIIQCRNMSIYLIQLMQLIENTYGRGNEDFSFYAQQIEFLLSPASMLDVVTHLYSCCRFSQSQDDDSLLNSILHFIDTHYHEDISLQSVADEVNLTYTYVSGYFKNKKGINFQKYLATVRIDHAKDLLKNSNLSIARIAEQVGFGTTNTFIRNMKQIAGTTPDVYRKTHQEGVSAPQ